MRCCLGAVASVACGQEVQGRDRGRGAQAVTGLEFP